MATVTIHDVLPQGRVLKKITERSTVAEALGVLDQHNLTALPLVAEDGTTCTGFVDCLDLLAYLVECVTAQKQSRVTPPSTSLHNDDLSMIMERANNFRLHSLRERHVKNKSGRDHTVTVALSDPLTAATRHFSKGMVHRVAVTDARGHLVNVLTQSDVLAWAYHDLEHRMRDLDVRAEAVAVRDAFTVRSSDVAVDAFLALDEHHHAGAPVVDENGAVVGCLSTSDLKQLASKKSFLNLLDPVSKWLRKDHLRWVDATVPLRGVVRRMVELRLHRIFVVAEERSMKLVGVIALRDVLKHVQAM